MSHIVWVSYIKYAWVVFLKELPCMCLEEGRFVLTVETKIKGYVLNVWNAGLKYYFSDPFPSRSMTLVFSNAYISSD